MGGWVGGGGGREAKRKRESERLMRFMNIERNGSFWIYFFPRDVLPRFVNIERRLTKDRKKERKKKKKKNQYCVLP